MSLLLNVLTFLLVLVSLFMVLVILMQRSKSDGGVGAAMGGGVAEQAFGGETGNVLTRATTVAAVLFFVLGFGIGLGVIHQHRAAMKQKGPSLPNSAELTQGATPATDTVPAGPTTPVPAPDSNPSTTPAAPVTSPTPPAAPSAQTSAPAPVTAPATTTATP